MGAIKRVLLVMLSAAALLLLLLGGSAAALRSISIGATRFEMLAAGLTFGGGGMEVVCEVSATMRLDSQIIRKIPNVRMGELLLRVLGQEPRGRGERCSTGRALFLGLEAAPSVKFVAFTGTLPAITSIEVIVVGVQYQMEQSFGVCLVTANVDGNLRVSAGGRIESFEEASRTGYRLESVSVRRISGILCPRAEEVTLKGAFRPQIGISVVLI